MDQPAKIALAWELHKQNVSNGKIAKRLEVNRETVSRWISGIGAQGLLPFLDSYRSIPSCSSHAKTTLVRLSIVAFNNEATNHYVSDLFTEFIVFLTNET